MLSNADAVTSERVGAHLIAVGKQAADATIQDAAEEIERMVNRADEVGVKRALIMMTAACKRLGLAPKLVD